MSNCYSSTIICEEIVLVARQELFMWEVLQAYMQSMSVFPSCA